MIVFEDGQGVVVSGSNALFHVFIPGWRVWRWIGWYWRRWVRKLPAGRITIMTEDGETHEFPIEQRTLEQHIDPDEFEIEPGYNDIYH